MRFEGDDEGQVRHVRSGGTTMHPRAERRRTKRPAGRAAAALAVAASCLVLVCACRRAEETITPPPPSPSPSPSPTPSLPAHLARVWPPPGALELDLAEGTPIVVRVDVLSAELAAPDEELSDGEVMGRSSLLYDGVRIPLYGYTNSGGWLVEDAMGTAKERVSPSVHQLYWSVRGESGPHQATFRFERASGEVWEHTWQFELVMGGAGPEG